MFLLVLGIVIFIGIHLVPTNSSLRERLVEQLGVQKYKGLYALIALLGLIVIIFGKAYAPFIHLWQPPLWGRHLAMAVMPFAFYFLAAANMPSNIKRFTRHPMLWGSRFGRQFICWQMEISLL